MKEQREKQFAIEKQNEMEKLWASQQNKKRSPKLVLTENVLDFKSSAIIEEKEEDIDSLFDIDSDKQNTESTIATQGFDTKDLDIDEMNFNLIRNSNAFKTKSTNDQILNVIEDDDQPRMGSIAGIFDPARRSEEDYL